LPRNWHPLCPGTTRLNIALPCVRNQSTTRLRPVRTRNHRQEQPVPPAVHRVIPGRVQVPHGQHVVAQLGERPSRCRPHLLSVPVVDDRDEWISQDPVESSKCLVLVLVRMCPVTELDTHGAERRDIVRPDIRIDELEVALRSPSLAIAQADVPRLPELAEIVDRLERSSIEVTGR
jgi:hypothetical protein